LKAEKFQDIVLKAREDREWSQKEMGDALDIGERMVQRLEAGDTIPKGNVLKKYEKKLAELPPPGNTKNRTLPTPDYFHVGKPVPYYDLDVSAGNTTIFDDRKEIPKDYLSFTPFNDCDLALNVYGDSMYPKYQSGDVIAIKEIHDFKTFIQFGEVYLVVTHSKEGDNQKFIKFVRKSDKKDHYKMVSENPKHDPFDVPINDIRKMFLVKGKVELNSM
jgi:phage repressor protein C with HTH and peptisase S24 domain